MTTSSDMHYQVWGDGPPVLALHGLGVESSSFTGLATAVGDLGLRMMAADLPGFGLTPAPPDTPLSPPALAAPVIELARRLETKPLLIGLSLGGRVALEVALRAPELFRGVVMMAPPLPRRTHRWAHNGARLLSPEIAERVPVEWAWPVLRRRAARMERELVGDDRHNWLLRASKRAIYYVSCPATRWAFVSAIRELALDPAFGPDGVWTRLEQLSLPAAFVWGEQDRFVNVGEVPLIEERVPHAFQIRVPCAGHYDNGPHFRCMEEGALAGIRSVEAVAHRELLPPVTAEGRARVVECQVLDDDAPPTPVEARQDALASAV
jgi:pimeloyl-ACP methyl ester carboxylesterase